LASQLCILDRRFNKLSSDYGELVGGSQGSFTKDKDKVVKAIQFKAKVKVFQIKKSLGEVLELLKKKRQRREKGSTGKNFIWL
jgi:hypothetical protein